MRSSAVVQGLKSLASKLHPQLPLSPKESQRLLAALTTSFRKRLDEAYPLEADSEGKRKAGNGDVSKVTAPQLHSSSAAFADRHLAAVLTSPLLAKNDGTKKLQLDLAAAKIALEKNPAKDPISLLEEYHERGAATVPIASLCLETFKSNIENLPEEERQAQVSEIKAGKRVLLWLWNSKVYETDAFAEDVRFMNSLTFFIVKEASEKYFWEWWQMDMALGNRSILRRTTHADQHYSYRWKGRMLRGIVKVKLNESKDASANAALESFLYACDLKEAAINQGDEEYRYPLLPAVMLLRDTIENNPKICENTDPDLFDRFIERNALYFGKPKHSEGQEDKAEGYKQYQEGRLWLIHPKVPSPFPAFRFLRRLFTPKLEPKSPAHVYFTAPRNGKELHAAYQFLIRTTVLLRQHDREEDANWVLSLAQQFFPQPAASMDIHLKKYQERYILSSPTESLTAPPKAQEGDPVIPRRFPFPSFG